MWSAPGWGISEGIVHAHVEAIYNLHIFLAAFAALAACLVRLTPAASRVSWSAVRSIRGQRVQEKRE